jgi:uncharacterized delta-60 repeat protein
MQYLSPAFGRRAWSHYPEASSQQKMLLTLLGLALAQPVGASTGILTGPSGRPLAPSATPPVVVSQSPARQANAGARSAVTLTFDQAISNAGTIRLFSSQYQGRRATTAFTNGPSATLTPTNGSFRAGEVVSVTVPASVTGTSGGLAAQKQVYQFTTAVTGGYGTFGAAMNVEVGTVGGRDNLAQDVVVGDVTNDGRPDLLVSYFNSNGSSVRLHVGQPNGLFAATATATYAQPNNPSQLVLADLNNDARLDLITTNYGGSGLTVRLNSGSGLASTTTTLSTGNSPLTVASGDLNADGNLDLVTLDAGSNSATVLLGNGTGAFTATTLGSGFITPGALALADVNNDGQLDLVYALGGSSKSLNVRVGRGDGTFSPALAATTLTSGAPRNLALADVDGDGDLDVAIANDFGMSVSLLENDGYGTFKLASGGTIATGQVNDVAFGDVNADGLPDLLISQTNQLGVLLNKDTPFTRFSGPVTYRASAGKALAVADMDQDGDLDVVTADQTVTGVSVLVNRALPPTITSFFPGTGTAGTIVTLTGTNLTGTTSVRFGPGALATAVVVNAAGTSLTAVVPVNAFQGPVRVTTTAGSVSTSGDFIYNPRPNLLTRLNPAGPLPVCQPQTLTAAAFSPAFILSGAGFDDGVSSVVVQPDNKVLVSGNFATYDGVPTRRLARLNPDGSLDTSFNPGGTGFNSTIRSVALQADGKVLVSGFFTAYNGTTVNRLVRLNADGSLDVSFNQGGTGANNFVNSVVVQADGKLLVAGFFTTYNGLNTGYLARLNPNGSLDTTFNSNGAGFNSEVRTVVVQADGKVLAGGFFTAYNGTQVGRLVRLNADGSLDTTFNAGGAGANSTVLSLAVQVDGKVLVGGIFSTYNGTAVGRLARLGADGSLDTTFNSGGLGFDSAVSSVVVLVDGKVLAGGDFATYNDLVAKYLVRLTAAGGLDTSFNSGGQGFTASVNSVAVQADRKILVGGGFSAYNGATAKYLTRLNLDGSPNTTDTPLSLATFNFSPGGSTGSTLTTSTTGSYSATATVYGFTSAASNTVVLTACPAPTLTGLSPDRGLVGTSVTITGTDLANATSVSFNGTTTSAITTNTATSLTVVVPLGATTGEVTVTAPNGTSNGLNFTVTLPAPTDLIVRNFQRIPGGTYRDVTITGPATGGGGLLLLEGDLTVTGTLTVQDGGALQVGPYTILGSGNFSLAAGGRLTLDNPAGISSSGASGAVQVTGARSFSTDASYRYGVSNRLVGITGTGLPTQVRELAIATYDSGTRITLSQSIAISQKLWVSSGTSSGSVLLTNGYPLTLLSSAQGTALADLSANGQVTGSVTVQRYIDPTLNPGLGYRQFSSPVQEQSFVNLGTSGFTPELSQASVYNNSATPGTTTPFPTVFDFDERRISGTISTYSDFDKGWHAPTQSNLEVGRGYTVQISASEKVSFQGTLNTADQNLPLSYTASSQAGWHLLGNPYAAPLDWSTVSRPATLGSAMYVFQSTSAYAGQYRSYANGIGSSPLIPSGQGFFVRTIAPETLPLSYRNCVLDYAAANDQSFQRTMADSRPRLRLALQGAGSVVDDLYVYLEAGATSGLDTRYDAIKLSNTNGLNLAAIASTGQPLAIQGLAALGNQTSTVPLTVQVPQAGSYTLAVGELVNFATGTTLVLHDQLLNLATLLTPTAHYAFQATDLTATGRFYLELRAQSALATTTTQALVQQVQVYPNPAKDRFQVQVPAKLSAATLTLYNSLGKLVRTQQVTGTLATLEVTDLARGVYLLRVQAGNTIATKTITLD